MFGDEDCFALVVEAQVGFIPAGDESGTLTIRPGNELRNQRREAGSSFGKRSPFLAQERFLDGV